MAEYKITMTLVDEDDDYSKNIEDLKKDMIGVIAEELLLNITSIDIQPQS